jgi:hypothetical protein
MKKFYIALIVSLLLLSAISVSTNMASLTSGSSNVYTAPVMLWNQFLPEPTYYNILTPPYYPIGLLAISDGGCVVGYTYTSNH